MTADDVRVRFDRLRQLCDPAGHDLLASLKELVAEVVEANRTIAAHIAVLEHEQRVAHTIEQIRNGYGRTKLRSVGQ